MRPSLVFEEWLVSQPSRWLMKMKVVEKMRQSVLTVRAVAEGNPMAESVAMRDPNSQDYCENKRSIKEL